MEIFKLTRPDNFTLLEVLTEATVTGLVEAVPLQGTPDIVYRLHADAGDILGITLFDSEVAEQMYGNLFDSYLPRQNLP